MKKETFCRYIRQYETDMFRFAKSIVGTQADGEDAMQESILKAYENIDTLRSRRKFKAWIFQILANECYQILRNRKRQEPTDPFEFPEQEHSSDYWTEDMVSEDGEILSYILRMPKQHQEVLILYYYDEFSNLLSFNIREGNIIEKKALTKATHIIHASDWAKQSAIIDYGIPNDKISVLEFGANITTQSFKKYPKKDKTLHILFLGVDWQRKGGDIAIETCRILNTQGIKSMIHIIGPIEVPESCKDIPYIEFIGFLNKNNQCDYERIIQYMSSSDILLLPTQAECAGIVFVEASAYSMPIFTYDTGGISNYVINGINGYRLPLKSDSYEFASKIENCIKSGELSLMQEYAANLYKEKLNWAHWSKRFKKIIDNI